MSKYQLALSALPYMARYAYDTYRGYNTTMGKRKRSASASKLKRKYKSVKKRSTSTSKARYISKKKSVRRQLRDIRRSLKSDQARHTRRTRATTTLRISANQAGYSQHDPCGITDIEAACAALRYYDPSAPSSLVTAAGATGTYTRQIHFESVYSKLEVRNNYLVPVKLKVYCFVPKHDTNIPPSTYFSDGITDQEASGTGASSSPLLYPTDFDMVNDNWKSVKTTSMVLEPGRTKVCAYMRKAFDYDPSNADTHSLEYQAKYMAQVWYVRVEGIIGHDTTLGEYTTLPGGVDLLSDRKWVITYDAGVNLNDISYSNGASATFTNAGLVSILGPSDNIGYSVT